MLKRKQSLRMVRYSNKPNNYCYACGATVSEWGLRNIIDDGLAKQWKLTTKLRNIFDIRESSYCPVCENSLRARTLAEGVVKVLPRKGVKSLTEWIRVANKEGLKVAEINGCGQLHVILENINKLAYSEYVPAEDIKGRLKNFLKDIPNKDITNLDYKEGVFDLVLHSDTLEHVEDYRAALSECKRVLKPGGWCLFTIPLIKSRKTRTRKGLAPSFHGSGEPDNLVFWEFGGDVIKDNGLEVVIDRPEQENYVLGFRRR